MSSFDFTNVWTQIKFSVPLLEMMKVLEYREKASKLITSVPKEIAKEQGQQDQAKVDEEEATPVIYLGTTITKIPS